MTNERKAVIIAIHDGTLEMHPQNATWIRFTGKIKRIKKDTVPTTFVEKLYLTDLNYLVPVAVKVRDEISKVVDPFNNEDIGLDIFGNLDKEYSNLTQTPEGTYQPLFDAVFNAIVYFENQNQ